MREIEFDKAANEAAVTFTTLVFRLLKAAQMHELAALRTRGVLENGAQQLRDMTHGAGGFLTVLFAGDTVFVNGQPVRAPRAMYENILAAGEPLALAGFNELTIRSSVSADDLGQLLDYVVHRKSTYALPASVTLQNVDPADLLGDLGDAGSIAEQVASAYAAATVLVRRSNQRLLEDDQRLARHVKRVGQRLVTLTRTGFVELLALARRPAPPTDHATILVNAAILGALAGRVLTEDVHALLRITMAALQMEIGKPRVAGMYRADSFQTSFVPALNQAMRRRLPASTAVMLLQAGRAAERPMQRAVVSYEAAHLYDGQLLGWPYDGQIPPTVEAVIASLAVRVTSGMAAAAGPDDLVRELGDVELGKVERATLDLIFSVLGLLPKGTPVEMTNGWRGVVVSAGPSFAELERARIVCLIDEFRRPVKPEIVPGGGPRGWVKMAVTLQDDLLSRQYEQWAKQRTNDDMADELPSTTGVLQPDVADSIADRASLHFDADAATNIVDRAALPMVGPTTVDPPTAHTVPARPPQFAAGSASAQTPASLPPQFQQPAAAKPAASIPGAWVRPKPAPPAEESAVRDSVPAPDSGPGAGPARKDKEPQPEDEGDFDALKNIVLFD